MDTNTESITTISIIRDHDKIYVLEQIIKNKDELFQSIKSLNKPTVIILKSEGLEEVVSELSNQFSDNWEADFQMNLSMDTEKHVYGTFDEIRNFVYTNNSLWDYEEETKKIKRK